jgi:hypothetical protein
MYIIPNTFDPKSLIGEILVMICFNSNQITLHFETSTMITFEGEFIIEVNNIEKLHNVYPLGDDKGLLAFIETEIKDSYTDEARKNLKIKFSNNSNLILVGNDEYESYMINKDGAKIIV